MRAYDLLSVRDEFRQFQRSHAALHCIVYHVWNAQPLPLPLRQIAKGIDCWWLLLI